MLTSRLGAEVFNCPCSGGWLEFVLVVGWAILVCLLLLSDLLVHLLYLVIPVVASLHSACSFQLCFRFFQAIRATVQRGQHETRLEIRFTVAEKLEQESLRFIPVLFHILLLSFREQIRFV